MPFPAVDIPVDFRQVQTGQCVDLVAKTFAKEQFVIAYMQLLNQASNRLSHAQMFAIERLLMHDKSLQLRSFVAGREGPALEEATDYRMTRLVDSVLGLTDDQAIELFLSAEYGYVRRVFNQGGWRLMEVPCQSLVFPAQHHHRNLFADRLAAYQLRFDSIGTPDYGLGLVMQRDKRPLVQDGYHRLTAATRSQDSVLVWSIDPSNSRP